MNSPRISGAEPRLKQKSERLPFRLTPIKAAMLGISLLGSYPMYADAEGKVAAKDLKAENAKLKQALAQIQKQLATQKPQASTESPAAVDNLQAEIARLKQALAQKQQAGANSTNQIASPVEAQGLVAPTGTEVTTAEQTQEAEAEPKSKSLLKEITVRAQKRSEVAKLKEIPKSVSQVNGSELQQYSANNVTDILKRVGNVQWNFGNPRTGSFSMRGLNVGNSDLIDPSVMIVVDGVSQGYGSTWSGTDFFDTEAVAAERGPRGSAGRKFASVGEITFNSNAPTFSNTADIFATYGSRNTVKTQAVANTQIIDDVLALRTSFYRNASDGYYTGGWQDIPQRQTYGNQDRTEARVDLLYQPTDKFKTRVNYFYQPKGYEYVNGVARAVPNPSNYDNNSYTLTSGNVVNLGSYVNLTNLTQTKLQRAYFANALPSYGISDYFNYPTTSPANGSIMNALRSSRINSEYKLPSHTLKFIAGYDDSFFEAANDDLMPYNVSLDGGFITRYLQLSQELRLESDPGGIVDYKTGIFNFYSDDYSNSRTRYGGDAGAWYATGISAAAGTQLGATGTISSQYDCLYSGLYCAGAGYTGTNLGALVVPTVGGPGTVNAAGATGQGRALMSAALNNLYKNTVTNNINESQAIYNESQWHLDKLINSENPLTLTTGIRATYEHRQANGAQIVADQGAGALLNPVSIGGVQLGGFATNGTTGALTATGASLNQQTVVANELAEQFFGTSTYAGLTAQEKVLVANAQAVRKAQISTLYNTTTATPFAAMLLTGNASLNYKIEDIFNNSYTPYITYQRGAKSGFAQVIAVMNQNTGFGTQLNGKPEISNVFEIGLKTQFFNKRLDVNADVFVDNIQNFQQTVNVVNPIASLNPGANCPGQNTCYTSASGNVAGAQVRGVELDTAFRATDNLGFRFSGAYNDAFYTSYTNAALPAELQSTAYGPVANQGLYNMTGKSLPRAPKFTGNLATDYSQPIFDKYIFHTNLNLNYVGRQNYDLSDSRYGWINAYWLTDFSIGIGRKDRLFDVNVIAKNVFNTDYITTSSWNSYTPSYGRWIGVQFSSKI